MKLSEAILVIIQNKPQGQQITHIKDAIAYRYDKEVDFQTIRKHLTSLIQTKQIGTKLVKHGGQRIYYPLDSTEIPNTELESFEPTKNKPAAISLATTIVSACGYCGITDICPYEHIESQALVCSDCGRNKFARLTPQELNVYKAFKKYSSSQNYQEKVAAEVKLSKSTVRVMISRLRQKGVNLPYQKERTHIYEIKAPNGSVCVSASKLKVYQAAMSAEFKFRTEYVHEIAAKLGISHLSVIAIIRELRKLGVAIPTSEQRESDRLEYLKSLVTERNLTVRDLKDKAFLQQMNISRNTMKRLVAKLRSCGVNTQSQKSKSNENKMVGVVA